MRKYKVGNVRGGKRGRGKKNKTEGFWFYNSRVSITTTFLLVFRKAMSAKQLSGELYRVIQLKCHERRKKGNDSLKEQWERGLEEKEEEKG